MSKGLINMTATERTAAVSRRMRSYDPKGANGLGTLAAFDYYTKHMGAKATVAKKESPSDLRRREKRKAKVAA